MNTTSSRFQGIIPPIITPMKARDVLDIDGLERLIEKMIQAGVHGIFVLGTTGEAPSLSYALRRQMIEHSCRIIRGRVPVLVGITDTAFEESIHLAEHSAKHGVDALVVSSPYYAPLSQPELGEYLEHLITDLPLPLFLYNMPSHTKMMFEISTIRRVIHHEKIIGLKDSSANMCYYHQVLREARIHRPDWSVLVGPEELLAESLFVGGHGGVCGGANLFPNLFVKVYEAHKAGNYEEMQRLHHRIIEISSTLYKVGRYGSAFLKAIKGSLNLQGICEDYIAEPFHRFENNERELISEILKSHSDLLND